MFLFCFNIIVYRILNHQLIILFNNNDYLCGTVKSINVDFLNQIRYFLIKYLSNYLHEAGWTPFKN